MLLRRLFRQNITWHKSGQSIAAWREEICYICSGSFRSEQYWLSLLDFLMLVSFDIFHYIHIKAKLSKVVCEWHLYQQISIESKYSLLSTFYGFYISMINTTRTTQNK